MPEQEFLIKFDTAQWAGIVYRVPESKVMETLEALSLLGHPVVSVGPVC
jgi:hypothetical protein